MNLMEELHPIVTVVVPCYNNEKTIKETIESVLCQTFSNWELICVDDGSIDSTVKIIKSYCERDNRIKLMIRDCNPKGGSHCRNIGGFASKGDYLIFLDGDDLLSDFCLEHRIQSIEGTQYDFVVFPMGRFLDNETRTILKGTKLIKNRNYLYYYASGTAGWQVTSPIIRSCAFSRIGGFNIDFSRLQDIEFYLRLISAAENNFKIEYDSKCDCYYRISTSLNKGGYEKYKRALQSYEQLLRLIEHTNDIGIFKNKRRLSRSVACIYLHAYILYNILSEHNIISDLPDWLNNSQYSGLLLNFEKQMILYSRLIFPSSSMNTYVLRALIKLLNA